MEQFVIEGVKLLMYVVLATLSGILTAYRVVSTRFDRLEATMNLHSAEDTRVQTQHTTQIASMQDRQVFIENEIRRHGEDIVRLETQHEGVVRELKGVTTALEKLDVRMQTMMDFLVQLKVPIKN